MKQRFFLGTVLLAVLVWVWSGTQLPDRVAIHFGFDGTADGWMSRTGALVTSGALILGNAAVFLGLSRWFPSMPTAMINLPDSAKRRWIEAGQEDRLRRALADDLHVVGGMTMLLLVGVEVLTVIANRRTPAPELGASGIVLVGGFLIALTIWTVALYRKYRRPPA